MAISHKQLKVFTTIAALGSVSHAATKLHLTQPAVSTALANLEETLSVKLFDRVDRKMVMNHNGHLLYPKALAILQQSDQLLTLYTDEHLAGDLTLAASTTIGNDILPTMLVKFKEHYPTINIHLTIANTANIIDAVEQHRVDMGFIEGNYANQKLVITPFIDDEVVLFVRAHHPLTQLKTLPLSMLKDYPFIVREPGSGTREIFDQQLLPALPYQAELFLELGSGQAICHAVQASDAIGCVSKHVIQQQPNVQVLSLKALSMKRTLAMVRNKNHTLSHLIQTWQNWIYKNKL